MNYSSALFVHPDLTLEDAQEAKVDAILDRLDLRSGGRLLEIGCGRSEEHTSELQSLMRISYAVFCLKKKTRKQKFNSKHLEKTIKQNNEHHTKQSEINNLETITSM